MGPTSPLPSAEAAPGGPGLSWSGAALGPLLLALLHALGAGVCATAVPAAPLPPYSLTIAASEGGPRLTRDSTLRVLLRPQRRVSGPVEVRCFLLRDGEPQRWPVQPEISPSGACLLRGRAGELLGRGTFELLFHLRRPRPGPENDPPERVLRARVRVE